jgi:hypothetical protein
MAQMSLKVSSSSVWIEPFIAGMSHDLSNQTSSSSKNRRKPKQDDAKAEVLTANSRETEIIAKFNCNLPLASSPLARAGVLELSESHCGVRLDTSQQS